jgi:hypothetical protein
VSPPGRCHLPARAGALAALIVVLALTSAPAAQELYEPRELAEGAYPVVQFQFRPQVGEGWVERTTSVVEFSFESAGAETVMVDSVSREMRWEVLADTDSGYVVGWGYGPQLHYMNSRKVESLIAEYLEATFYVLLVDSTGRAVAELDLAEFEAVLHPDKPVPADSLATESELDSLLVIPDAEDAPRAWEFQDEETPPTAPTPGPPQYDRVFGLALRDWNARLDVFFGQVWDEGESVFEIEELQLPGMEKQRLFNEVWLESVINPEERPVARVEIRYFTVSTDTLPLDDVGFLDFLTASGIEGLSSPALTDLVADGRGTWYIDAGRMLIYEGSSMIRGMVQRWPLEDSASSVTARFTIRRHRRAEPLVR